jgi:hypothetical protein
MNNFQFEITVRLEQDNIYLGILYLKKGEDWIELKTSSHSRPGLLKQQLVEEAIAYSYDLEFERLPGQKDTMEFDCS